DRQAGAVDGDRTLVGEVLGQFLRCTHAELDGAGVIAARDDFADPVDVTADQVPAQASGGGQGLFQVDLAAALEVDEGGALEGLDADVGPEPVARQLDGGQAHAVDGDAVAE